LRSILLSDAAGPVALGSVVSAILGARLLMKLSSEKLRLLFVVVLLALAVQMLLAAFGNGGLMRAETKTPALLDRRLAGLLSYGTWIASALIAAGLALPLIGVNPAIEDVQLVTAGIASSSPCPCCASL
jgi:hypothetical protein